MEAEPGPQSEEGGRPRATCAPSAATNNPLRPPTSTQSRRTQSSLADSLLSLPSLSSPLPRPPARSAMSADTTFKRFVEVGRVVLVNDGPDAGKLATIVEIIDHNRVRPPPSLRCPASRPRDRALTPCRLSSHLSPPRPSRPRPCPRTRSCATPAALLAYADPPRAPPTLPRPAPDLDRPPHLAPRPAPRPQALIEGPSTGVTRQSFTYRRLVLTPYVLKKLPRAAGTTVVKKVWDASEVEAKWNKSAWAQKRAAQQKRRNTSDFERFEVMLLKKQRRRLVQVRPAHPLALSPCAVGRALVRPAALVLSVRSLTFIPPYRPPLPRPRSRHKVARARRPCAPEPVLAPLSPLLILRPPRPLLVSSRHVSELESPPLWGISGCGWPDGDERVRSAGLDCRR